MKGQDIKKLRKRLGLTQIEFAKEVGVSFATANRWEQGHFKPLPICEERLKELQGRVR